MNQRGSCAYERTKDFWRERVKYQLINRNDEFQCDSVEEEITEPDGVNEENDAKILMTLTSPNCPVAETLPVEVEDKVKSLKEINNAEVEITFDPTWTQDMMSEEAKLELGML